MLRLKVEVVGDGTMRAQGVLSARLHMPDGDGEHLCETGLASRWKSQNTKQFELRLRTQLTDDGAQQIELARA